MSIWCLFSSKDIETELSKAEIKIPPADLSVSQGMSQTPHILFSCVPVCV